MLESYGFNTKNGIEYSGGMENFYFEMPEAFTDGADVKADEALEHENAAKEENKAFIDSNAGQLLEDYRQTVEKIKKALRLRKG